MEFSYRQDWKMAKGVTIPICEAGKLFFMTKSAQMGRFDISRKYNVANTRTCTDTKGHNF